MWERHTALHGITVCGLVPRLVPHDTTWKCRNRVNMHMHMHTCMCICTSHAHGEERPTHWKRHSSPDCYPQSVRCATSDIVSPLHVRCCDVRHHTHSIGLANL